MFEIMKLLTKKQVFIIVVGGFLLSVDGLPIIENDGEFLENGFPEMNESTSEVPKDLYVVRAVVYEVGILANISSSEEESDSNSNEEIDLQFFRQHHNGSVIDLSNISAPIQTNISRKIITGIAPISDILSPAFNANRTGTPIPLAIANTALTVHSNISSGNVSDEKTILSNLAPLLSNLTLVHDVS